MLRPLKGRPVYITFDIDALDAAVMPATGTPTPGGLGYWQALAILGALARPATSWAPISSSLHRSRGCTRSTTRPLRSPTSC